ncbi:MAG: hypothetical protein HQ512_13410 [Rhodospirillales bacterium]|nr:hypothetical protein [Rhodospirillales bacterium]
MPNQKGQTQPSSSVCRRGGFLVAETLSKMGVEVVFTLSGGFSRKSEWFDENTRQRSAWVESNKELLRNEAENSPPHPLQISTAVLNALGENDFLWSMVGTLIIGQRSP